MRRPSPVLARAAAGAAVLALAVVLAACEKAPPPPPKPVVTTAPEGVVVTVSAPSLTASVAGLRAYADAVQPGGGAMMSDAMAAGALAAQVGATSLDGLDLAAPLHLVVLDPKAPGGVGGLVVVGKAADKAKLDAARGAATVDVADGVAVIGAAPAVAAVATWARGALAAGPAPARTTVEVHLPRVLAFHAAEVDAVFRQMAAVPGAGEFMTAYADGVRGLLADSERLVAALEADGARAQLELTLVARPGTRLHAFAAAQRPSDLGLIGKLPAAAGSVLLGGRLALGPYRDAWMAMLGSFMKVGEGPGELAKAFAALADVATGEMATVGDLGAAGMTMTALYGVSDEAAADRILAASLTAMKDGQVNEAAGIKTTVTGIPEVARHDGVVVRGTSATVDLASVPEAQRAMMEAMYKGGQRSEVAVTGGLIVTTLGGPVAPAIDAIRGKATAYAPTADAAALLDLARGGKDSVAMILDVAALTARAKAMMGAGGAPAAPAAGGAMLFGLGAVDGGVRVRVVVPALAVAAAMGR